MKTKTKQLIEKEIVYQDAKWVDHKHSVGEWILILQNLVAKTHQNWLKTGDTMALYEIVQLAASAIYCLDGHSPKVEGRKLTPHLQRIWEDAQEFVPRGAQQKEIDNLKGQVERLRNVNKQQEAKIKELEVKNTILKSQLSRALTTIPKKEKKPSYQPRVPHYEPWYYNNPPLLLPPHPKIDNPWWDNPVITCKENSPADDLNFSSGFKNSISC